MALPSINPTSTKAWRKLTKHRKLMADAKMSDFFASDAERFNKYTLRHENILVDYAKNIVTDETLKNLISLAKECKLSFPLKPSDNTLSSLDIAIGYKLLVYEAT